MPKLTVADKPVETFRFPQPAPPRYEQESGNRRYRCPACGRAAIVSVRIGLREYTCPVALRVVTAMEIATAETLQMERD